MSSGDSERQRLFTRRAILIGSVQAATFAILTGRLYYLQVIQAEKYKTLAEENRINLRLIAPRRGQITDRYGTVIANNQQNYRVVILPEQIDNLPATLERLSQFIELTESDRKRIERDLHNENTFNAIPAKDNLTWSQVASISVHSFDLPGIDIDTGEVRSYPYSDTTSHVLGYIGTVSKSELKDNDDDDSPEKNPQDVLSIPGFRVGKSGIEKQYDLEMRGQSGSEQMEVNAHGRVVRELTRSDPVNGKDIALTLDIGLQQFVQQRLLKEESAAAVVMNIHNGDVIALASQPGFDPNLFTFGIPQDVWQTLTENERSPMLNKVVSGVYAPGSTFKPMVAMAALEAGMLTLNDRTYCPGYFELGDHRFHCWKHGGHGSVNLTDAVAGSCDTFFYDLGHRVGIDRIQSMAKRFGFGARTGIDLPQERNGFIPSRTWKLATQGSMWQQGETLITSIGQGYVLTSPLQLACMSARLANGGKAVVPRILDKINGVKVPVKDAPAMGLETKNLQLVCEAMAAVVNSNHGTAYSSRIMNPDFAMAGKTGTSQVRRISESEREDGVTANDELPWKQRDHALFSGFAPVGAPKYAIAVLLEHGGSGGHNAAPIARDIMLECQTRALKGDLG